MDLAIVTDQWNEAGGGRERYLAELATFLRRRGDTVRVYCHEASRPSAARHVDLEVVGGPAVIRHMRLRRALNRWRVGDPARPVLAARPFAMATHYQLHAGLYEDAFDAERESLDASLRRALFWPTTALNARRALLLHEEARLLKNAAGPSLMVFTDALREGLVATRGVSPHRIRVSPPGVDLALFRPQAPDEPSARPPADDADVRLLFVGHNYVLKGLFWILAAMARGAEVGLRATLTVAGRGPIGRFRRLARTLGIDSRVTFLGPVDQTQVATLYRTCDALIHPTFYDPFPRTIVEALASGCPVITTRACGGAALIRPGVNGDLIDDPRDTERLASALAMLADRRQLARLRDAAAADRSRFGFEAHAADVIEWLSA